jgi:hypothetical protein
MSDLQPKCFHVFTGRQRFSSTFAASRLMNVAQYHGRVKKTDYGGGHCLLNQLGILKIINGILLLPEKESPGTFS